MKNHQEKTDRQKTVSTVCPSDARRFKKLWCEWGGQIVGVRRTGEVRYLHPAFSSPIRANDRRHDVPAVLMARMNQVMRRSNNLQFNRSIDHD